MATKKTKNKPHRSKPYDQKIAERQAWRRPGGQKNPTQNPSEQASPEQENRSDRNP